MKNWQDDLLRITEGVACEHNVFERVRAAARNLGFEYCAYGFQAPYPLTNPKVTMLNDYPQSWRDQYVHANYLKVDPTVLHGRRSQKPIVWDDNVFADIPQLWQDAQQSGLRVGWAQSSYNSGGAGGMLTLCRSSDIITAAELTAHQDKFVWLTSLAHLTFSRIYNTRLRHESPVLLTVREREVLKWTADGKSAVEIGDLLFISKNTVDFHIKNAILKLQTANKTAAVVRAATLGLLN